VDEREQLKERLLETGLSRESIDQAAQAGRLPALAVERALGGGAHHTLTALARESRVPADYLRTLMQAIGRPSPGRGERAFTDEDLELAKIARVLLDAGLPRTELTEVARVIGQGMSQSAEAVRRMVGDALLKPGDSEDSLGARYAEAVDRLEPIMPALFNLSFRAHLRDGISRELITTAERQAGRLSSTRDVAVAFADMVDYTVLGDRIGADELGTVAGRFAEIAISVARPPVRLVKTIGDAALFVSPDVEPMIKTLVDLRDAARGADPRLPDLRIGVAYGQATPRAGDWFGSAVNLASRVADEASPDQLLATEEVCQRVDGAAGGEWRKRRKRSLKGVDGRVRVYSYETAE
jgi:adenylate cyclase